jgi:hypothetical protein
VLRSSARVDLDTPKNGAIVFKDTRATAAHHADRLPSTTDLHRLDAAFRAWVDDATKPQHLLVRGDDVVMVPLERALTELLDSTAPLAPAHGNALGLADDATIATAAADLLHASTDPDGPHCRSFRSASYFLAARERADGDAGTLTGPNGTAPPRPASNGARSVTSPTGRRIDVVPRVG